MEFLFPNYINTSTAITVDSNTVTAEYILNPNTTYKYWSDGYANDSTTTTLQITFATNTAISRFALVGINLKNFAIYRNNTTTTFTLQNAHTTASTFITNSSTSMFLRCSTAAATSINIVMKSTIVANQEKEIGYLYIGHNVFTLNPMPDSNGYTPMIDLKQNVHQLSDGRKRINNMYRKKTAKISVSNITSTMRNNLKLIYNWRQPFVFVPFGTSTGWDEFMMECVWQGDFGFYKVTDNAATSYYAGTMDLKETSY